MEIQDLGVFSVTHFSEQAKDIYTPWVTKISPILHLSHILLNEKEGASNTVGEHTHQMSDKQTDRQMLLGLLSLLHHYLGSLRWENGAGDQKEP